MYSVFIVDDEQIVLDGIRKKMDWENSNFTFAGEATDGEIALSMIQEVKPDILITDIKMPFMDGLKLSQILKRIQPWIRIIILSGHDEFDYAKKAISIGVEDYILKPFTHETLNATLQKVSASLDKEHRQLSDISLLKEKLESTSQIIKDKLLIDLLLNRQDISELRAKFTDVPIPLDSSFYKVLASELRQQSQKEQESLSYWPYITSVLKDIPDSISVFISPTRLVCILFNSSEKDIEDSCYSMAEAVEHIVRQKTGGYCISAIGKTIKEMSKIHESYAEAEHVLELAQPWNAGRILSAEDIKEDNNSTLQLPDKNPLVDRLKYAGSGEIDDIINMYIKSLDQNSEHFFILGSYIFVDVIMAVSSLIENLGGNVKDVMPEILSHSYIEKSIQDENICIAEIKKILEKVLRYRDSHLHGKYSDVILKAKDYIQKNYASQDTCLRLVAEEVNLSPNHFSAIFSQECKTTFIEYLTNVRIEAAKKLLKETDMKGSDIAYECGFSDPHYFSFIFKKNTGLSPREYKNKEQK